MKSLFDRRACVLIAAIAAIAGVDVVLGAAHPYWALAATVAILAMSNVALPSRMWLRFTDFCRWIPWALACNVPKAAAAVTPAIPEDPEDAAQRKSYGLDLAEYDARILIGMPLGHLERLAIPPVPPSLKRLEDVLWPEGWVHVIEEHLREQGWSK